MSLIEKGNAHATLDDALNNIPFSLLVQKPWNLPTASGRLPNIFVLHNGTSRNFHEMQNISRPNDPMDIGQRNKPPSEDAWQKCIDTIKADRRAFIDWFKMQAALWIKFLNMVMAKASQGSFGTGRPQQLSYG